MPPYTAFVVTVGTIDDPEVVQYFYEDYDTEDGELPAPFTSKADYLAAGFYHVATLHIDKVNNTSTLVYVNNSINSPRLNFHQKN